MSCGNYPDEWRDQNAEQILTHPHSLALRWQRVEDSSKQDLGSHQSVAMSVGSPYISALSEIAKAVYWCIQVFLEPEGRHTPELYVQGFSTGLPERLQLALLHTLPGETNALFLCSELPICMAEWVTTGWDEK